VRARAAAASVIFVCSITFGLDVQAQNLGIVRGRVVNASGAPVVRIKVTVAGLWGYSDSTGRYLISRVPFGRYKVTLERDGRSVAKIEVDVHAQITDVPVLRWP
jgi:carboxypeptidase family protein